MHCTVQYAAETRTGIPAAGSIRQWVDAALTDSGISAAELTVRFVSERDMADCNRRYRDKNGPTNVLSFPAPPMPDIPGPRPLGDILISPTVALMESRQQLKPPRAHFAHLVVHGVLHLLGHDHVEPEQAEAMETLERRILSRLGFDDPYRVRAE